MENSYDSHIYQLFDWFETTDEPNAKNMRFAINSNPMAKKSLLDKLIAGTQNINRSPYILVAKHMALKQNTLEMAWIGINGHPI